MSSTGGSGAVFFLGTRAHYQVLQQPETRSYDMENGNASTETIYQNPSVQELWPEGQEANSNYINKTNWNCYDNEVNVTDENQKLAVGNGMMRRAKRRQSETALCEEDGNMQPALLNDAADCSTPKPKSRRLPMLSYMWSLARRRRRMEAEHEQNMRHLESALAACTYRESCRCLDCQSRYFECDESSDESSDDSDSESDCSQYEPPPVAVSVQQYDEDEDDEVFVDTIPGDNTSTDMLLDAKEPPAVHPTASASASTYTDEDEDMQLEVKMDQLSERNY